MTMAKRQAFGAATLHEQVREFREAMGLYSRQLDTYEVVPDKEVRLAVALVLEEAFELAEACFDPAAGHALAWMKKDAKALVQRAAVDIDLAAAVDACADTDYVVDGVRCVLGISESARVAVADAVHAANMAKLLGPKDPTTGKQLKPEGWQAPDIAGVLRRHGWAL